MLGISSLVVSIEKISSDSCLHACAGKLCKAFH